MSSGEPLRLTRAQVREIDRRSIEEYHIPGIVLMENAARAVADAADAMIARRENAVTIFCGGGNNGGDGFAVARHPTTVDTKSGCTCCHTRGSFREMR